MTEFGRSLPDRLVIENIGIMLTDVAKFLHKALIIASITIRHIYMETLQNSPNFRSDPNIKLKFSIIHFGSSIYYKAKADFQRKSPKLKYCVALCYPIPQSFPMLLYMPSVRT